jgi:hypothetical protein
MLDLREQREIIRVMLVSKVKLEFDTLDLRVIRENIEVKNIFI